MDNWQYLYKKNYEDGYNETTNMLYTPRVSQNQRIMCMVWDKASSYQSDPDRVPLTEELIDFFFEREVKHLILMQKYNWAPKILELDITNRKIFIEWDAELVNHIVMSGISLDERCPDWREQIFKILQDLKQTGYYKMALYPHCFILDKSNKIKTIDFYSCVGIEERYIPVSKLQGMIGKKSTDRFAQSTVGDNIDFKKFIEITMTETLASIWKDNLFLDFYLKLFGDNT